MRSKLSAALVILLIATRAAAGPIAIVDPGQGPVALADGAATGADELSGLAWIPGTSQYLAVSDGQSVLHRLAVAIDPLTGAITSATTIGSLALSQADGSALPATRDLEGIALGAAGDSVFVSDEGGMRIREHALATGRTIAEVGTASAPALGVYAGRRTNLGWESLSAAPDTGVLWTANEEALTVDGPSGAGTSNTRVRLQSLAPDLTPLAQWAYVVSGDTVPGTAGNTNGGVSDLVALPGGQLLVLERSAGLVSFPDLDYRNRLFLVDFAGATDVTGLAALATGTFTPVAKTLLWEGFFADDNFEGIALGPFLANGDRSLLLVSDDGNATSQSVLALRLVPEPASALLVATGVSALAWRGRGRS